MINNSVLSLHRGQINGVAQTVVGLTRAIGPAVAGSVYAWSVGRPPLGFRLVFFVAGSVYAVLLLVAMQLPASINKQRQSRSSSSIGGCELIKL
jgi:ATP-dependent RNA helicase DHX8/PRP22